MSTLRVNKLENTNTSNGGISIDTSGHVSIDGANFPTAGPLSNRNKVINGAMQVAQRTTSESNISSANTVRVLDRWQIRINGTGTWTISQSTEAPPGFSKSIRWQCTTADASPAAGDFQYMAHRLEGLNVQDLVKGTSSAKPVTVSFWVRSTVTGSYAFRLVDNQNSRQIGQNYTVNQADTWEYKTMTFAGDTAGALASDNANRLSMMWWLVSGSERTSGSIPTSWQTLATADEAAGQTANIASSTSNNFYITGVQLEVGETATPFEHRSYGDELAKCQRYFERMNYTYDAWTFIAVATVPGTSSAINMIGSIYYETKRTDPTVTSTAANTFRQNGGGVSDNVATTIGFAMETPKSCRIEAAATGIWRTSGLSGWISRQSTSTCYIDFDAEL